VGGTGLVAYGRTLSAGYPLAMAARDLQERIKKLILDRRLPSGAPLPTEPELMVLLGASRNSVREALKALQAMGIVEIRHGFGTYVGPMSIAPMIEGLAFRTVAGHYRGEDSLLQLLELREAVETGLSSGSRGGCPSGISPNWTRWWTDGREAAEGVRSRGHRPRLSRHPLPGAGQRCC
jgi:DNA-binding transcriptional regulator YhcF (GntR family)